VWLFQAVTTSPPTATPSRLKLVLTGVDEGEAVQTNLLSTAVAAP
jgi:hypothetical protein